MCLATVWSLDDKVVMNSSRLADAVGPVSSLHMKLSRSSGAIEHHINGCYSVDSEFLTAAKRASQNRQV